MIPSIETIVEELLSGEITKAEALAWLHQYSEDGCRNLRDEFAIHAPEPNEEEISNQRAFDRGRNPHNDGPPKPPLRSVLEIRAFLRYAYADAMLAERSK